MDLIDRQAAIETAVKMFKAWYGGSVLRDREIRARYDALPSAQPERKKEKWINGVCDQCGSHDPYWAMASTYYRSSFCPNCGADMRGEQDDSISD